MPIWMPISWIDHPILEAITYRWRVRWMRRCEIRQEPTTLVGS